MHSQTWRAAPGWALAAGAAAAGSAVTNLIVPWLVGDAVTGLDAGRPLVGCVVPIAGTLLLGVAFGATSTVAFGSYAAHVTARTRVRAVDHLVSSPRGAWVSAADASTRLLVDAAQVAAGWPIAVTLLLSSVSLVAALTLIALIDWWLLVGLLSGLVSLLVLMRRFLADTAPPLDRYRGGQAALAGCLLDCQRGAASIRAHGTWIREAARVLAPLSGIRAAGEELWAHQRRLAWRTGIFVPFSQLITLAIGGIALATGRIGAGELAAAVGYVAVVLGALDGLESAAGFNVVRLGRRRIDELLSAGYLPRQAMRAHDGRAAAPPDLSVENLSVSSDGLRILDDIAFTVPAGQCLAITGAPGAGRTTLALALAGVISPDSGQVRLGGRPVGCGEQGITLVPSTPAMVGETVGDLLRLGRPSACDDELRQAAREAHIHHVIDALPARYGSHLADLRLSGGELQRLAIAQALVCDSDVLVLDDATSSLDAATEHQVLSAVLDARRGRTCVLLSSRRSLLDATDRVMHLADGRLHPVAGASGPAELAGAMGGKA